MSLPRIAVDAMGGDEGVRVMVEGAAMARRNHDGFKFLLVGDGARIEQALADHPGMAGASEILHCDDVIGGDELPSRAIRRAKTTSMGLAVRAVKDGSAGAAVSAGNTGALMAMSKIALRTLPGIDRPALAALMPTLEPHDVVMLDLGANTEADARNLVQFAVMGAAYARIVGGFDRPVVRLLNIGTEEIKGTEALREAAAQLTAASAREDGGLALNFDGFVESDKINRGQTHVVVTDGFSGNIALKAIEGAARFVTDLLRQAFTSSVRSKIGFLVSRPATELLRHHLDPNNHNGAVFLGLNGVVVKSHGSATAKGVAQAVAVAARLLENKLTQRIADDLSELDARVLHRRANGSDAIVAGEVAGENDADDGSDADATPGASSGKGAAA
ncbi:phosphate acyltransferase PlsX [Erythrobacter sp.]|jgi:glycerol-3-phosphate acyltransferase PlsX|uniref:phosphate acyltransferase PlsX n=1 Tax=Erythrobacter sp. TaxID=1042 RepID=UPI002EC14A92|nr:phosphate acyltransferase PlsX [Erythrobacter sp.]